MNKQSYLDSRQLQNECNECIKILKSELLEIEKVSNNIKLVLNETDLKGEAMEAYKKQLNRYFEIFALMKEADRFDIIDYTKLKAEAIRTYDGDLICTSYERAKNDRDRYQSKANDERSKAASFNTTVTTLLPGGKVLVEHIPNPYESSAREYQNLADDCQKEMNLWHSKMEEFDAIEARTVGLFVAGKNKRTIAKMKLRTINKTPISGSRTRSGGGTGGLISYIPDTPKTTINEDVLKGAKILEDKLRMMTNEDGTPKYTEKEIQEMVEYVIKHHPYSLSSLYHIPSQYYSNQMDTCLKYAYEGREIEKGANLLTDYLRNLKNPDGTLQYTEEQIRRMVEYVKEHYPNRLSDLYHIPSQYYKNAVDQCLEHVIMFEKYRDVYIFLSGVLDENGDRAYSDDKIYEFLLFQESENLSLIDTYSHVPSQYKEQLENDLITSINGMNFRSGGNLHPDAKYSNLIRYYNHPNGKQLFITSQAGKIGTTNLGYIQSKGGAYLDKSGCYFFAALSALSYVTGRSIDMAFFLECCGYQVDISDPQNTTVYPPIVSLAPENYNFPLTVNSNPVSSKDWATVFSNCTGLNVTQNIYWSSSASWEYPTDTNVCYIVRQKNGGIGPIDTSGDGHWVCIFPIGNNKYQVINHNSRGASVITHDQLVSLTDYQFELRWD